MKKHLISVAAAAALSSAALAADKPMAPEQTYMQFARQNPSIFILGVGSTVPLGGLPKFNATADNGGLASLKTDPDLAFNLDIGYRLPMLPMHISLSYVSLMNSIDSANSATTVVAKDLTFDQNLWLVNAYYDCAITPQWVASFGAGVGGVNMDLSADSGDGIAQTSSQYAFAYEGVAKISYRFTKWSLGLSQRVIGTTMSMSKVVPGASNSKVYDAVTSFEIGYSAF